MLLQFNSYTENFATNAFETVVKRQNVEATSAILG